MVRGVDDATRLGVAQMAAGDVLADWVGQGGSAEDVQVWLDATSEVCIWVNGGGTTPSAWGDAPAELAVSVADHLHAELVDAAQLVLPLCPVHGCGLHPALVQERATWCCSVGEHSVGVLGSLASGDGKPPHE